jgi:hypothetical protein
MLDLISEGQMFMCTNWEIGEYITSDEEGNIVDEDGDTTSVTINTVNDTWVRVVFDDDANTLDEENDVFDDLPETTEETSGLDGPPTV